MLTVLKPMDVINIVSSYVSNSFEPFPKISIDIKPYLTHHETCNLNQNWDEAAQALADTPNDQRDDGYYQAVQEMEEKRSRCTCSYNEILKQQKEKS